MKVFENVLLLAFSKPGYCSAVVYQLARSHFFKKSPKKLPKIHSKKPFTILFPPNLTQSWFYFRGLLVRSQIWILGLFLEGVSFKITEYSPKKFFRGSVPQKTPLTRLDASTTLFSFHLLKTVLEKSGRKLADKDLKHA